jgi:hypothetical protein
VRLTSFKCQRKKKEFRKQVYAGRRAWMPPLDLKFIAPSECEILSGGLREPSHITYQLSKGDLEQNLAF